MTLRAAFCLVALTLLAACSPAQSFSDTVGNVRVTGDLQQGLFAGKTGTMNLQLYDASTGYPIDASDVQIRAGREPSVHASHKQLGVYSASVPARRHIDVLITTRDNRSIFLALQQK